MSYHIFIDGEAGTTGLQIHDRLKKRNDLTIISLSEQLRKDIKARREAINSSDAVFLCLPDDAAREAITLVENPKTVIIDASTAHRTQAGWTYGFPELSKEHERAIRNSKRIANPGCYASGFLSIVYPLIKGGIAANDYPFVCHAISGYSGAGKKGIAEYQNLERSSLYDAPRSYALTQQHKHLAEMTKIPSLARVPVFCPIIADFYQGMTVTVPLFWDLLQKKYTVDEIFSYFAEYYVRHNNIRVTRDSENGFLSANVLTGTNKLELFVGGNDERILLVARLDNLGKGASGAAVQNMNLALGIEE